MKNKVKKYIFSLFVTVLFGIYFIYKSVLGGNQDMVTVETIIQKTPIVETRDPIIVNNTPSKSKVTKVPKPVVAVNPDPVVSVKTPPIIIPSKHTSGYADGTYVGDSADAFYGNVQVQISVHGGVIVDAVALESPGNRSQSVRINSRAIPKLGSEAISAQSSKIDAVSGATYTSVAYKKSLTSALAKAKV